MYRTRTPPTSDGCRRPKVIRVTAYKAIGSPLARADFLTVDGGFLRRSCHQASSDLVCEFDPPDPTTRYAGQITNWPLRASSIAGGGVLLGVDALCLALVVS